MSGVREAVVGVAVECDIRDLRHDAVDEMVADAAELGLAIVAEETFRRDCRCAHADDGRCVFGAAAFAGFLSAAVDERFEFQSGPTIERADSFRPMELMSGEGGEVEWGFADTEGYFADELNDVGVNWKLVFLGERADFVEGLDDARLIVGAHHGDEGSAFEKRFKSIQIESAEWSDRSQLMISVERIKVTKHSAVFDLR